MSDNSASAKAKEMEMAGSKKQEGKESETGRRSEPRSIWTSFANWRSLVNEHGFTDFEFENEIFGFG